MSADAETVLHSVAIERRTSDMAQDRSQTNVRRGSNRAKAAVSGPQPDLYEFK